MVVSLCTGIGGFESAIEIPPAVMAETDSDCAGVLAHRFPDAANIGDWTELGSLADLPCPEPVLITAGLPCQPVSTAGERRGDSDGRWLFDALTGLLARGDERPTLLLENVRAITDRPFRSAMTRWRTAMRRLGYTLIERVTAASSAGAAHRRLRWFALAVHPDSHIDRLAATPPPAKRQRRRS